MNDDLNLIVMLTHNDRTVENAYEIFDKCKNSKAKFWGFKEEPLPIDQMKKLYAYMKECGKTTFLEVVEYTEEKGLEGAKMAVECGCDILMGTMFFDSINEYCKENNIKYMRLEKGVYGFDLLGYRYTGDAVELNKKFVEQVKAPVCIAGSINSYKRLDEIKDANPWAFTIGGAFFENKFDGTFSEQINKVCDYMERDLVTNM